MVFPFCYKPATDFFTPRPVSGSLSMAQYGARILCHSVTAAIICTLCDFFIMSLSEISIRYLGVMSSEACSMLVHNDLYKQNTGARNQGNMYSYMAAYLEGYVDEIVSTKWSIVNLQGPKLFTIFFLVIISTKIWLYS